METKNFIPTSGCTNAGANETENLYKDSERVTSNLTCLAVEVPDENSERLQKVGEYIWKEWHNEPFDGKTVRQIIMVVSSSSPYIGGLPCMVNACSAIPDCTGSVYVGLPMTPSEVEKMNIPMPQNATTDVGTIKTTFLKTPKGAMFNLREISKNAALASVL